jgi:uncharacterized membrane protein YfhO
LDISRENYILLSKRNNIQNVTGVDAIFLKDFRDYMWAVGEYKNLPYDSYIQIENIKNESLLNLLNIKYIISKKKLYTESYSELTNSLYLNKNYFPRAFIIPNSVIEGNKEKTLNALKNNTYDLKKLVILERGPRVSNGNSFKEVFIKLYSPNNILLNVELDKPGFLVLSEVTYPGWEAYDNDKKTEILKGDYLFRTIYLSKGKHEIRFTYNPISYEIGKIISLSSLTVFILIFFINYRKRIKSYLRL